MSHMIQPAAAKSYTEEELKAFVECFLHRLSQTNGSNGPAFLTRDEFIRLGETLADRDETIRLLAENVESAVQTSRAAIKQLEARDRKLAIASNALNNVIAFTEDPSARQHATHALREITSITPTQDV